MFSQACHSFCPQDGVSQHPFCTTPHYGHKWAVRILLECFLIRFSFLFCGEKDFKSTCEMTLKQRDQWMILWQGRKIHKELFTLSEKERRWTDSPQLDASRKFKRLRADPRYRFWPVWIHLKGLFTLSVSVSDAMRLANCYHWKQWSHSKIGWSSIPGQLHCFRWE